MKALLSFSVLWILSMTITFAQEVSSPKFTITGSVFDALTKKPVDFANIYLVGTNSGTNTEADGSFKLEVTHWADSLQVSQLGYETITVKLSSAKIEGLSFELKEASLELAEVLVKADPDPGKTLMEKVIARKPFNNPDKLVNYSYLKYNRAELDLNHINRAELGTNSLRALMLHQFDALDTTNRSANLLPIYFTETLTENYHNTAPALDELVVVAKKTLDLPTDKLLRHLEKFNIGFNVYDNWLKIFEKTFASPLSDKGPDFYHYYIEDSLLLDTHLQIQIQFVPKYKYGETFTGMMWINDSTYSVARIEMKMDKTANLNFVRAIQYSEEFVQHAIDNQSGTTLYMPKKVTSAVTFESGLDLLGIPVNVSPETTQLTYVNTSVIDKINLSQNTISTLIPVIGAPLRMDHIEQSEVFWQANRLDTLTVHERAIYQMIDSIRNHPRFKLTTQLIAMATTGYWEVGNSWSIGHYASLISSNPIEGLRFRLGVYSNTGFDEHWFVGGYLAYGQKDKQFKGDFEFGYLASAGPWSKTGLYTRSDYDLPLSIDDELQNDNLINSFFRKKDYLFKRNYVHEIKLYHEHQLGKSWRNKTSIAYREYSPSFDFTYYTSDPTLVDGAKHKVSVAEFNTSFRFSMGEKIVYDNFSIINLNRPSSLPILILDYTHGFKALNAPFAFDKINLSITQFLNLPPKSIFYYSLQFGKTFGTLPYLLLNIPTGSESYVSSRYAFSTMSPYEFAADRFVSLKTRLSLGGLLLDKIPLLQKIGLRERLSFNSFWGDLTPANLNFNQFNDLKTTGSVPFAEVGVGIENIFHLLSLEYIWRLNHLNDPKTQKGGLYTGITFVF